MTVNCLAPTAWSRLTAPLLGGDEASEESRTASTLAGVAVITTWLASPRGGRRDRPGVFDIRGENLGIAEGWHLGPVEVQPDNPAELGPVVAKLMAEARLNANMAGMDHEGMGFPSHSI